MDGVSIFVMFLGWAVGSGYIYSVIYCAIEGCDEWWHPFVFGALLPFWWLYENGKDIAINVGAVLLVFIVPVGLVLIVRAIAQFVAGGLS